MILFSFSLWVAQAVTVASPGAGLTLEHRFSARERLTLSRFGDCVVRAYPMQTEQAVLGWAVDPNSVRILYQIDTSKCLPALGAGAQMLRISPGSMRYILADALARSKVGSMNPARAGRVPALSHPAIDEAVYAPAPGQVFDEAQRKAKAELRASFANYIALSRLGECTVRKDARSAIALLKSEPGSSEEEQRFGAVMPVLESCVVGSTVHGDETAVRGEIGAALLRLAVPALGSAGPKAN